MPLGQLLAQEQAAESPLVCWSLPGLMARYYDSHVQYSLESKEIEKRVVELYAKRMDPSKVILLADEYAALKKTIEQALANVKEGRCEAFKSLREKQIEWQAEMEYHVRNTLSKPDLKIDRTLSLQMDADKRPRPKTVAERNELRRKLLHFQLANYVAADTKLDEAKETHPSLRTHHQRCARTDDGRRVFRFS